MKLSKVIGFGGHTTCEVHIAYYTTFTFSFVMYMYLVRPMLDNRYCSVGIARVLCTHATLLLWTWTSPQGSNDFSSAIQIRYLKIATLVDLCHIQLK